MSAEFRLSDEQREAFMRAYQGPWAPDEHPLPDTPTRMLAAVESIVASEREAARRLGVEQGMLNAGRAVAAAYKTGLADGKRNAEAAGRALVERIEAVLASSYPTYSVVCASIRAALGDSLGSGTGFITVTPSASQCPICGVETPPISAPVDAEGRGTVRFHDCSQGGESR